ncbi:MAG: L-seryl-tRNA(Sec) selenium transferase [Acidimicrobiales bacterium]
MASVDGHPPSVDVLARSISDVGLPAPLLVAAAREAVAAADPATARRRAVALAGCMLQPVVNATGVLLHTNLGRAPLAVQRPARAVNVEMSLETGHRGSRSAFVASLLSVTTGAERATVVNNGAAAVLLALTVLAPDRTVVVSRGELVEIGGGFRIPEVLETSGARLVEVGTTNRTRLDDYRSAIEATPPEDKPVILKVHQSNYRISGFIASVGVRELAALGARVVVDLGSGLLDADTPWLPGPPPRWLAGEPAARQTLEDGASLVTFSGDKLLGGPQAGVIAGRADLVDRCARHPLARALRPGSLVLGALQDTLLAYVRRDATSVAFWRMATVPVDDLRMRAKAVADAVGAPATVVDCSSVAGAGSVPGTEIPSVGVSLPGDRTAELRRHRPAVIATIRDSTTVCDLRSVEAADDPVVVSALRELFGVPSRSLSGSRGAQ